jgi:hypothetical protein
MVVGLMPNMSPVICGLLVARRQEEPKHRRPQESTRVIRWGQEIEFRSKAHQRRVDGKPLPTIPVASARLTDELFDRDTPMQLHPTLWCERSVACPAPHGTFAIDVWAHGFQWT